VGAQVSRALLGNRNSCVAVELTALSALRRWD